MADLLKKNGVDLHTFASMAFFFYFWGIVTSRGRQIWSWRAIAYGAGAFNMVLTSCFLKAPRATGFRAASGTLRRAAGLNRSPGLTAVFALALLFCGCFFFSPRALNANRGKIMHASLVLNFFSCPPRPAPPYTPGRFCTIKRKL